MPASRKAFLPCAQSTLRRSGVDNHGQLSLPVIPRLRVRHQLTHEVRNVGHVGVVWRKETAHQTLMQRVLRNLACQQFVWPHCYPLHKRIAHPHVVAEKVGGLLVVLGWRDHAAQQPHEPLFEPPATGVEAAWVIHRNAAHVFSGYLSTCERLRLLILDDNARLQGIDS